MTEGVLSHLAEEELRRYRGVLRVRHGLSYRGYDTRGELLISNSGVPSHLRTTSFSCVGASLRMIFRIGDHTWAELHEGMPAGSIRARGRRGGWANTFRYTVPLP